jgi:pyridoxal phosphate enzyme (YggS family)
MTIIDQTIAANVQRVAEQIEAAARRAGRQAEEVTVVAVSKTQPVERIAELLATGIRHLGENRVQEAANKFPTLSHLLGDAERGLVRHLVGSLQTNKAGQALRLFERVDSVDSLKVAQALGKRVTDGRALPVLLEVYVGADPARPGLRAEGLVDVVGPILEVSELRVEGLMTVAPLGQDARSSFARVRQLRDMLALAFPRVHFGVLSMGMSDDFPVAIEEGATEVRLGTALFGPRRPQSIA